MRRLLTFMVVLSLLIVAAAAVPVAASPSKSDKATITLETHDSFAASKSVLRQFTKFAEVAPKPLALPTREIARNRDNWISEWTDTVLR